MGERELESVNLNELYTHGIVKDGGHEINVPIRKPNGDKYNGKTYLIPLEYLYYNEMNGRIGVALSDYESKHEAVVSGHNDEYNNVIQKIIVEDNEKTKKDMLELKRDIAIKGQDEPGYVLLDGRVVDGNRRFTAKRMLAQDPKVNGTQYFEAVILTDLSVDNQADMKNIKSLELKIQFGKLSKVDYDPIDRSIDAYKTIVLNNIMTAKEYADDAGIKKNEVDKLVVEAELIVKFLDFIHAAPDNYAIAKQMDLDGPLRDFLPQYKKIKKSDNLDQILNTIFASLIQTRLKKQNFKDDFRTVAKEVIGKASANEFIAEMEEATDTLQDVFSEQEVTDNHQLYKVVNDHSEAKDAIADIQKTTTSYSEKVRNAKRRSEPINLVEKAINSLDAIDQQTLDELADTDAQKLNERLRELQEMVAELLTEEV